MGPDKMKGPGLAVIIGGPSKGKGDNEVDVEDEDNSTDEGSDDLEMIGNDILDAIKSKDARALADAVKSICLSVCSDAMGDDVEDEDSDGE